jgi:hypothetical protein
MNQLSSSFSEKQIKNLKKKTLIAFDSLNTSGLFNDLTVHDSEEDKALANYHTQVKNDEVGPQVMTYLKTALKKMEKDFMKDYDPIEFKRAIGFTLKEATRQRLSITDQENLVKEKEALQNQVPVRSEPRIKKKPRMEVTEEDDWDTPILGPKTRPENLRITIEQDIPQETYASQDASSESEGYNSDSRSARISRQQVNQDTFEESIFDKTISSINLMCKSLSV